MEMEADKIIDTAKTIQSKDIIARMASDIEAKHAATMVQNEGIGKFWEKLTIEEQEQLRDFILNPPIDTPTPPAPEPSPQPTPQPAPEPTPQPVPEPTPQQINN